MKHLAILLSLVCLVATPTHAQEKAKAKGSARKTPPKLTSAVVKNEERLYKTTPQGELKLHLSFPADWRPEDKRPGAVFFFGGGWTSGSYKQFTSLCDYLASRGIVAASADYRIKSIHKTKPDACVEDAKSAVRWMRAHAAELGIEPGKLIVGGGSAGGHLAACTATIEGFNAASDPPSISAVPNALVLFNPAVNIGTLARQRGASAEDIAAADAITPNTFIKAGLPPSIQFFGTDDKLKVGGDEFIAKARALGVRAEMWTAANQPHGFFNASPWIQLTALKVDEFLTSLGYLSGEPTIKLPIAAPSLKSE
jgi:acetyl esterase/lipase